ncbi:MAG: LTA synthase family protein [Gemmatimonadales bacterium]
MLPRLRLLARILLFWLAFFTAARVVFLLYHFDRSAALTPSLLVGTFAHGLRLDLASAAYLSAIPFLLVAASALGPLREPARRTQLAYLLVAGSVLALLAAADLEIFRVWGRRIDAEVLPYLKHPREAWASAGASPRALLFLLALALAGLSLIAARRGLDRPFRDLPETHPLAAVPLLVPALLLAIPARGGIQQIPINQSSAYFSTDPFANQAAVNYGWNFFDSWSRGLDRRTNPYAELPPDSAAAVVKRFRGAGAGLAPEADSLLRVTRPNVIVLIWESFTARAVPALGGVPGAAPGFERLIPEGLFFTRFYATGDRTDKGLAAILSGAPTVPGAAIVKVPAKAATLPNLARDFGRAGYATSFYYGGELGFANIGSFVRSGGFALVRGKRDFPPASWTSKWGAHDQAVSERILADLRTTQEPFFVAWKTLLSHEPFDVPGPVRVPGEDRDSRYLNAIAYTDWALGRFLELARKEPWWDRTLVVIVSDHSKKLERIDAPAPYKSARYWYHVPMLWLGGALARRRVVDRIGSHADLAPTLLELLGIPGAAQYRWGRNLFTTGDRPFAYYAFDDGFGVVTAEGSFVWERAPGRITSSEREATAEALKLGKALLQMTYQDYLER